MKKILCFILMLFTFCLCGCSTIKYYTVFEAGKITQCVVVTLDHAEIESQNLQLTDVKSTVRNVMNNVFNRYKSNFLSNNDGLSIFEKQTLLTQITHPISDLAENDDNYSSIALNVVFEEYFGSTFSSVDAYKYFFCVYDEESDVQTSVDKNLFYDITTDTTYTVYNGLVASTLITSILNQINAELGTNFTGAEAEYVYAYLENNLRVKSNADYVMREDGVNYHIWTMSLDETNQPIEFYLASIHPIAWYVLALVIAVAFVILSFVIVLICKKVKNSKNKNVSLNTDKIEQNEINN